MKLRGFGIVAIIGIILSCGTNTGGDMEGKVVFKEGGNPQLPGITEVDGKGMERLKAALAKKKEDYTPRTHHLEADGVPTFINRLIFETSPYLLQHAHNPVNWFPWGPKAFERAKAENKPVLLSVGYSTCHWCHVMERESFEDLEISAYINANFIPIKVDREERPDVDDVYMSAVHILAGRGGWPMTVVMTPDQEPFFGGTYFPPRDRVRSSRRGFLGILQELSERYQNDREGTVEQAKALTQKIQQQSRPQRPGNVPGTSALTRAATQMVNRFDPQWGGFGKAPKFPRPTTMNFLLRYYRRTLDQNALHSVTHTLDKMAAGGMYDHVGGGFHRYSTDTRWLVPHFEKMLYDNAQLAILYLEGWQVTQNPFYQRVTIEILDYISMEMIGRHKAFYSATDADSPTPSGHDEEGWFFTWTPQELSEILDPSAVRAVTAYYGVTPRGNFEGRTIFNTIRSLEEVAAELETTPEALWDTIELARSDLYEARSLRPPPILDDKVIVAWNGLMISAFARAALALNRPDYQVTAQKAAAFLLENVRNTEGHLHRTFNEGQAKHVGTLEDYAFFIQGLLDLFELDGDQRWFDAAKSLQEVLDTLFVDEENGGYFVTPMGHESLISRLKSDYDGAEPSGNSVTMLNLMRFSELTGEEIYRTRAEAAFASQSQRIERAGTAVPNALMALDFYLDEALEIIMVSPKDISEDWPLRNVVKEMFVPNRVLIRTTSGEVEALAKHIPLVEMKEALGGEPTVFVCTRGVCERPTTDPEVLRAQLSKVISLDGQPLELSSSLP